MVKSNTCCAPRSANAASRQPKRKTTTRQRDDGNDGASGAASARRFCTRRARLDEFDATNSTPRIRVDQSNSKNRPTRRTGRLTSRRSPCAACFHDAVLSRRTGGLTSRRSPCCLFSRRSVDATNPGAGAAPLASCCLFSRRSVDSMNRRADAGPLTHTSCSSYCLASPDLSKNPQVRSLTKPPLLHGVVAGKPFWNPWPPQLAV